MPLLMRCKVRMGHGSVTFQKQRFFRKKPSSCRRTASSGRTGAPPTHDGTSGIASVSEEECQRIGAEIREHGFALSSSRLLSPDLCYLVKDRMPGLFRGEFETGVYPDEWHWRQGISLDHVAREMCNVWKSDRLVASVVLSETIGAAVARIMGWGSVRIGQDDLIDKPPASTPAAAVGNSAIGYHQDSAYVSNQFVPREENSITVWMALDDADEEMGCLEYAAGSHRWRLAEPGNGHTDGDSDDLSAFHGGNALSSYRASLPVHGGDHQLTTVDFRKVPITEGYAIFHHQDVWHGSGPNRSDRKHRRALVGHYLRGDVEFRDDGSLPFGSSSYIYGRYKRIGSRQLDETFFPIIYANAPDSADCTQQRSAWLDGYLR